MTEEQIPLEIITKHAKVINDLNFNQQILVKKIDAIENEQKQLKELTTLIQKKQALQEEVAKKVTETEEAKTAPAEAQPAEVKQDGKTE